MGEKSISIILGAGFSKPAGLPLAGEIPRYFIRDNSDNLLNYSSGEWRWNDYATDDEKNNGSYSSDAAVYGYILNQIVRIYIEQKGEFTNYEDFYQFILDNINSNNFTSEIFSKSYLEFQKQHPTAVKGGSMECYYSIFQRPTSILIMRLIQYLISDLLFWRISADRIRTIYSPFLDFISGFEKVDIITLNHDLIVEHLITVGLHRSYSDGFTRDQKTLMSETGNPLNIFVDEFIEDITLIKLHGSIDLFLYPFLENASGVYRPTGEALYFKTLDCEERHKPVRYDPETGKIVQDVHDEITPQFITGTRKSEIIEKDNMYQALYSQFKARIHLNPVILIIGYSYSDLHVNQEIIAALKSGKVREVINVNPSMKFPFEEFADSVDIKNFRDLIELNRPLRN